MIANHPVARTAKRIGKACLLINIGAWGVMVLMFLLPRFQPGRPRSGCYWTDALFGYVECANPVLNAIAIIPQVLSWMWLLSFGTWLENPARKFAVLGQHLANLELSRATFDLSGIVIPITLLLAFLYLAMLALEWVARILGAAERSK